MMEPHLSLSEGRLILQIEGNKNVSKALKWPPCLATENMEEINIVHPTWSEPCKAGKFLNLDSKSHQIRPVMEYWHWWQIMHTPHDLVLISSKQYKSHPEKNTQPRRTKMLNSKSQLPLPPTLLQQHQVSNDTAPLPTESFLRRCESGMNSLLRASHLCHLVPSSSSLPLVVWVIWKSSSFCHHLFYAHLMNSSFKFLLGCLSCGSLVEVWILECCQWRWYHLLHFHPCDGFIVALSCWWILGL